MFTFMPKDSRKFFTSLTTLSLVCLALCAGNAVAQVTRGALSGTITDSRQAVVAGATVTARNSDSGEELRAASDAEGSFVFPSLAVGRYQVRAEASGFKQIVIENVFVEIAKPARVNLALEIGATTETVTIAGGAQEIVNTTSATLTNVVEKKQITDLPLPSRNPLDLIRLQAGIVTSGTDTRSAIASGLRGSTAEVTQDGINVRDNYLRTDTFVSLTFPTVEATGEFSVSTGTNAADAGRGVAQVRIVTASGKNDFHGSLYEYHRNSALNANSFFNNTTNTARPFQIQNRFGFTASGPVFTPEKIFGPLSYDGRNRSHWFLSLEMFRQPFSAVRTRTVLTEEARKGLFRYVGSDNQIKTVDLLTIGAARQLNPLTMAQINATPLPNTTIIGDGLNTAGFRFQPKGTSNNEKWSGRFDQVLTENSPIGRHKLEFVTHRSNFLLTPDFGNGLDAPFPGGVDGVQTFVSTVVVAAIHSTFGSRATNEIRFGTQRTPGSFARETPPMDPFFVTFASITSPLSQVMTSERNTTVYHFQDHFSLVRGGHTLRMGAEAESITWHNRFDSGIVPTVFLGTNAANPDGILNTSFPLLPAGATGTTIANRARAIYYDLTGHLNRASQTFNVTSPTSGFVPNAPEARPIRQRDLSLYVQDQWRVRRNLTLTPGLRWEFVGVPVDLRGLALQPVNAVAGLYGITGQNNLFNPGVTNGSAPTLLDFIGGPNQPKFYNNDWNNFAPSFGLAYSPSFQRGLLRWLTGGEGRSSIRGGYSISYTRDGLTVIDAARGFGTINPGLTTVASNATPRGVLTGAGVAIAVPQFKTPISDLENYRINPNNGLAAFDPNLRTPYVQQWSFGFEREIARNIAIEARYVGNHAIKLFRAFNINEVNIFENGFLEEFQHAQKNLTINRGASFAPGATGTVPLPILSTLFTGLAATSGFTNAAFINNLTLGNVGTMASTLAGSPVYLANRARLAPNFFRANPNAGFANLLSNGSFSIYHALQMELRRRFIRGWSLQANYTFSKVITDSEGFNASDQENFYTLRNIRLDRHRAAYSIPHTFVANFIYELPFGPGRKFWNGGNVVLRKALDGWQVQGIVNVHSGPAGNGHIIASRTTFNNFLNSNSAISLSMTPQQFRDNVGVFKTPQGVFYVNPNLLNITTNPNGTIATATLKEGLFGAPPPGQLGTFPRNWLNAPLFSQVDFSVIKRTRLTEQVHLEFRAEFFNAFNAVNFGGTSFSIDATRFGQITGSFTPRLGQLAMRVNW